MDDQERASLRAAVATVIRVELARKQITKSDLARRAGISEGTVSNYCSGRREPRMSDAGAIAEVFGMDLPTFSTRVQEEMEGRRAV